jgi:hypothetical protein
LTAEAFAKLDGYAALQKSYDPNQPRDARGRWSSERGAGDTQVASLDDGVRSDAGRSMPAQTAQASPPRPPRGGGRGDRGRESMEEEVSPSAEIRVFLFNRAILRLRAIDPRKAEIMYAPGWVPNEEDVGKAKSDLEDAIIEAASDVARHAFEDHVLDGREFSDVGSEYELESLAQRVIGTAKPEISGDETHTYIYESSTNTLVVLNHRNPEQSTIFRPTNRRAYVDDELQAKRKKVSLVEIKKVEGGGLELVLNWIEYNAIRGCLNLACQGIDVPNFEQRIGVSKAEALALMHEAFYDGRFSKLAEDSYRTTLSPDELSVCANAIKATFRDRPGEGIAPRQYDALTGGASFEDVKAALAQLEMAIASG